MAELTDEQIKSHLRTLYTAQKDAFVWLRDVSFSLGEVVQLVQDSDVNLPLDIRKKLDELAAYLDSAQVSDLALQAIDGYVDGLAAKRAR